MSRRIRALRSDLGVSQEEFASTYGFRLASLRWYESARYMPPRAVRSYLKVIAAEPEKVRKGVAG